MCWLGSLEIEPEMGLGLLANLFSFFVDFLKRIFSYFFRSQYTGWIRIALSNNGSQTHSQVSRGYRSKCIFLCEVIVQLLHSGCSSLMSDSTLISKCSISCVLHFPNQLFLFFYSAPSSDMWVSLAGIRWGRVNGRYVSALPLLIRLI